MKQPHEYPEMCREAAIARVGADRMGAGLSCIPDPVRGDLDVVERLRTRLHAIESQAIASTEPDYVAVPAKLIHEQSKEHTP